MWPFRTREAEAEVEEFADQTSTIMDQQYERAVGSLVDVSMSAALEVARSLVSRSFAAARVENLSAGIVTPSMMAAIGRSMVWPGECVYVLRGGGMYPVADFDVEGMLDGLRYRLEVAAPSGSVGLRRGSDTVLHFRNVVGSDWWRGDSPLAGALATGQLASRIDVMMRNEANGAYGYLVPTSDDPASEEMRGTVENLRDLDGRSMLVRTVLRGVGGDAPAPRDWKSERIGFDPTDTLLRAREAVFRSVLGILGVPPSLFLGEGGDGGAGREAWRRFLHGTVEPMGAQVESELQRMFGPRVGLSFDRLMAHDVAGQARAVHVLVQSGVELAEALRLSGFTS